MLNELIRQALNNPPPPTSPAAYGDPAGVLADAVEAMLVEATGGGEHVVKVQGRAWTIQHPLPERFEPQGHGASLLDCRYNRLVDVAMAQGAMFDGLHRVWIDPTGVLRWEEIEP
ncbi:hypothetical protein QC999_gp33 [Microbacterium phage Cressida]|uniref:Uncharacterized protein n=1 Tax=Microbacterium phage Cressida TaxID=2591216 RepID=A0A514DIA0_9CAUD|nr:hypothetical protein QC999_gp33 [Microbacterium phage Cressida]QDH93317.1 hypothetical protein PBI_CRESSIDA_75 [Microbacterium phage Cressida]